MDSFDAIPRSGLPDVVWPAMCDRLVAAQLAVMFQLELTQWWSPDRLLEAQFSQISEVVQHAWEQSPWYRRFWSEAGFDPARGDLRGRWQDLPIVTRATVHRAGDELHCRTHPSRHGNRERKQTSGSTGTPVTFYKTDLCGLFWQAITLRDHVWNRRDLSLKLAAIRASADTNLPPGGLVARRWGSSTAGFDTGPAALMSIFEDVDKQHRWLIEQNPDYFLSNPTNLRALAIHFKQHGGALPRLRQVRAMGESLPDDVRQLCRDAWGVELYDAYSSEEVGYMALQCPVEGHTHYHVQSENVMVEVIDDAGRVCGPGEVGRVVVTTLHNFATPLVRYDIGDYAQVGEPCSCGRGLPVLARVMGRERNMLTLPDGSKHWPGFHAKLWADIAPIRQVQFVQDRLDHIEARVVMDRPFTDQEREAFISAIKDRMRFPHEMTVRHVDRIERSKGGKYEDFMSLVDR